MAVVITGPNGYGSKASLQPNPGHLDGSAPTGGSDESISLASLATCKDIESKPEDLDVTV